MTKIVEPDRVAHVRDGPARFEKSAGTLKAQSNQVLVRWQPDQLSEHSRELERTHRHLRREVPKRVLIVWI